MTEAAPVLPGGVDDSGDCQDEGTPMQISLHSSSLNLQLSLNYQYCLIPQHFPLIPLMLCAPHKHMLLVRPHRGNQQSPKPSSLGKSDLNQNKHQNWLHVINSYLQHVGANWQMGNHVAHCFQGSISPIPGPRASSCLENSLTCCC